MVRVTKSDEFVERIVYSGKILMYLNSWDVLYPVVDIIRLLPKNTIITFKYARNQEMIKMYGSQYNHNTFGLELKSNKDYTNELYHGKVQAIFLYSNTPDIVSTNLLSFAEKFKTNIVCFSTIDNKYHFYDYTTNFVEDDVGSLSDTNKKPTITEFTNPEEVIEKMILLNEMKGMKKLHELFPDFEILDEPGQTENILDDCLKKMKNVDINIETKKEASKIKVAFDPHLSKIKKAEYQRQQKKIVYPDDPVEHPKCNLSQFFKKK